MLVVLAAVQLHGQIKADTTANPSQDEVEQLIDGSLEDEDAEAGDLERIAETRAYYLKAKIDLNTADAAALDALNLLSPAQVDAILERRRISGDYQSELELQAVRTLSIDDVRALLPYVTVERGAEEAMTTLKARFLDATGFAAMRSGFQSTSSNVDNWVGPRVPLYLRVRRTAGRQFSMGVVIENDAGERYGGPDNPLLFDYVSAHVFADELPGILKTVALGDYGLNWGQGLISYTGFGTGKGAFVMDVQRNARWLIPHASVREQGFYRGAAAAAALGNFKVMALASRTKPDGGIDTLDALAGEVEFASFRLGGLHRTPSEIAGRRSNTATSFGGAVGVEQSWGRISLHYLEHHFEVPFAQSDRLYQTFNFNGDLLRNASLAWQTFLGPVSWFGEAAVDGNEQTAVLSGVQLGLDRKTDVSLVYRRYDAGYRTLYNNVFGASRRPENEQGIYLGVRMQVSSRWVLQGFGDVYAHPYARFRLSTPSRNYDGLLRLTYEKRREHSVYVQLRHRSSERDLSRGESGTLRTILPYIRSSARIQGSLNFSKALTFRARVEFARTEEQGELFHGTIVYQDILWKPAKSKLSATARIALIDTDDFESRIYAYENDLLYRFRIPAYYGQGYRTYLNLRHRTTRDLTLELRGAYGKREESSDQVELAGQVRWRF